MTLSRRLTRTLTTPLVRQLEGGEEGSDPEVTIQTEMLWQDDTEVLWDDDQTMVWD
jgi:hypothetical protein